MNAPHGLSADADTLNLMKFGIGQPVPRQEDPTLLKGQGRYTDDMNLPNQAYAVMVRSQVAHGVLKGIDIEEAKTMPGVLGVWTGADLNAAGYGPLKTLIPVPNRDGSPMKTPTRHSLATDKVRFVGDPVAFVVAETLAQAKDAAEAVMLDIDALPAVTDAREAAQPGAPIVFDDAPGNICVDYHYGDSDKVAEAFAKAAHVTRLRLVSNRIVVCAMEPRSAIGEYDAASDRYTLRAGNQGAFGLKHQMADLLKIKPDADARADRQCRRLVRHEGLALSRICRAVPRLQDPRPAGQMDRRALGQLSERPARPRPRFRRRAGARQGRQVSGRAPHRLRQCRRLSRQCRPADGIDGRHAQPRRHLPHAADRGGDQGGLHPHLADRRLSRRRPARGQLLHGAADRHRVARDGHRQRRDAPPQPHPPGGDALQDGVGHDLRQRRVHDASGQGAEVRRRRGLRRAQGREQGARQAARHGHRRLSRSHGAADEGDGRHPLRAERRRHHHHRHARLRPGPLVGLRPGADREARHPVPAHKADPGRQRPADRRRRHRRVEVDHGERRGDRRSLRQGHRQGQADRRRGARSLGGRHRVQARPLHHRRHRPRHRHHGAGRARCAAA